jgi:glutamate formiminotransferase / 5-formyltetrahydrofolate cyclo-ligase
VTTLLAVPNISEGRDPAVVAAVASAFGRPLLDVHTDPDHHRSVFTLAGAPGQLAYAVVRGAAEATRRIDLGAHHGLHPRVGAVDVAPIVFLAPADRGAACAEALVLGDALAQQLALPVFLYGALAGGRTRAELRRGGPAALQARMEAGELTPDFGPPRLDPSAGAVLVGARPPLVAFNLELEAPATLAGARRIAAVIREGGPEGLPGVRAIGLWLEHENVAQVSTNVEDHERVRLAQVVQAVGRHSGVRAAELVGLAPAAAFRGFPADVPVRNKRLIEDALAKLPISDGSNEA